MSSEVTSTTLDQLAAAVRAQDENPSDQDSDDSTMRHVDENSANLHPVTTAGSNVLPYPAPGDPTSVARRILADLYTEDSHYTLRFWRGDWYRWAGPCWTIVSDEEITGQLWLHLDRQTYKKDNGSAPWCPTGGKVTDVRRAVMYLVHLPDGVDAPMWVDGGDSYDAGSIVGMNNGLLYWPDRKLIGHTPRLFNTFSLPYSYLPDAECPKWLHFIDSTFEADRLGALALQEFFGYTLTSDNSRQKGLMLIGPPGGGKGTITNTLTEMIGRPNVASTDPKTLNGEFGLMPLVGKKLALLSDARTDGPVGADVLGRLLRIIGGDPVDINRKGQSFWSGFLATRFVWVSNDLARFTDNSGAILRRWIVVRLTTAVKEKDRDNHLGAKLRTELPGILNWALDGLDALNEQGRFTEPGSQAETLEDLRDSVSPVAAFLRDCYDVTGNPENIVALSDVLKAYGSWAADNGYSSLNRSTLMDRIKGCPEPVDAKNTVAGIYQKKTRLVFGIEPKAVGK